MGGGPGGGGGRGKTGVKEDALGNLAILKKTLHIWYLLPKIVLGTFCGLLTGPVHYWIGHYVGKGKYV